MKALRTGRKQDRFWEFVEEYGVTVLYTAPTAIRAFIRWGDEYPNRHDLSSLRLAWHGRRTDQSRGMDMVSHRDWRRALPDRRYLVADRNWSDHDYAAPRRDAVSNLALRPCRFLGSMPPWWMTKAKKFSPKLEANWLSASRGLPCFGPFGEISNVTKNSIGARSKVLLHRRWRPARQGWLFLDRWTD